MNIEVMMIAKFYGMIRDAKSLGAEILNATYTGDESEGILEAMEEIECMMMHCECCLDCLEKAMQKDFPKFGK